MTTEPVTLSPGSTRKQALHVLTEHGVTTLPVVDEQGVLLGVLGGADLIEHGLAPDPRTRIGTRAVPREAPTEPDVAALVVTEVVTVHPDDDLAVGLDRLLAHRHAALPVVDLDRRVVGVLSRSDLVRLLSRSDEEVRVAVSALLRRVAGGEWTVEVRDGIVHLTGSTATFHDATAAALLAGTVPGVLGVDSPGVSRA